MTGPAAFERAVARDFAKRGYATRVNGGTNDWGVDVFATKGDEKIAIQAKMYRGSRAVNRRQIFELYGAAAYFGCTESVIATDGALDPDAADAAAKLGIRVVRYDADWTGHPEVDGPSVLDFDRIWERSIMPLAGRTLVRSDGSTNQIIEVDWAGVTRISSSGNRQRIDIDIFRWAIERVLEVGSVTRDEINAQYEKRASSGIVLLLTQVPEFDVRERPLTIKLRSGAVE